MSELKRCPFCGDEVEIVPTGLYHWKYAIHHKSKTECILDANAFALPYEEEDAVRMWNTRADRKTEPTWEQVKEYCNKRCLGIVDSALRKRWYKDEPHIVGKHADVIIIDESQTERSE